MIFKISLLEIFLTPCKSGVRGFLLKTWMLIEIYVCETIDVNWEFFTCFPVCKELVSASSSLAFVLQWSHFCGLNTTPTRTTFIKYARQSIASALFRAVYRVEPALSGLSGPQEIVRVMESPYNRKYEYYRDGNVNKGIRQRKHHFNCEIYTACMYLQMKTFSSGIYKGLKCSNMFVCSKEL